jgi:hypothetical protein
MQSHDEIGGDAASKVSHLTVDSEWVHIEQCQMTQIPVLSEQQCESGLAVVCKHRHKCRGCKEGGSKIWVGYAGDVLYH